MAGFVVVILILVIIHVAMGANRAQKKWPGGPFGL